MEGKLSDQGQLNIEFYLKEFDFNARNKKVSEATYLEVRDIILKFKHKKAPVTVGITAEILRNVCSSLWSRIRGLVEIMRSEEEMPLERTMEIECGIYI
jgi:hypothetical protein